MCGRGIPRERVRAIYVRYIEASLSLALGPYKILPIYFLLQ